MRIILFILVATFSFDVSAEERNGETDREQAQIIRLCENPDTGEQVETPLVNAKGCPEGFSAYDDLTPVYVETIHDMPPPKPLPAHAEKEAHAE